MAPCSHSGQLLGCRVLLAEDGLDNQRTITNILEKAGAQITIVENGQLAVSAALESIDSGSSFDIILMDMHMPVMDGYTATEQLRSRGYQGPIIALTPHSLPHNRDKCLAAGCEDCTFKPLDRGRLLSAILRNFHRSSSLLASSKTSSSIASVNRPVKVFC